MELRRIEAQTLNRQLFSVLRIFLSLEFIVDSSSTLAYRVLVFSLSNLTWSQNKSWSLHQEEERAKGWHSLDLVLTIDFWSLLIAVNALTMPLWRLNYPLLCCSNDWSALIKNVEQAEVNKLHFGPEV